MTVVKKRKKSGHRSKEPLTKGLVPPGREEVKSGCLWCPLLPWSSDFFEKGLAERYERNAELILAKERDGHTVHTRCVSEAWDPVDVLFVGEAPGKTEDSMKWARPFVGRSGAMLRRAIEHAVPGATVGFTNVLGCRPPRNRNPNKTEVQSCAPRLVREIQAREPKVVVVLGNKAMEFLAGQTGITMLNGKVLDCVRPEFPDLRIVACLHPAYVLRFDHEIDKFVEALTVAARVLSGDYVAPRGLGDYYVIDDADDAVDLLTAMSETDEVVAFDTETGGVSPFQTEFPGLLCVSLCEEEGVGYVIPWDHVESKLKGAGKKRVREAFIRFFTSSTQKVAQNPGFDLKHIRREFGVWVTNVWDTMMGHFCLDENRGTHGLKRLAYAYTGMGGYERDLEQYQEEHPDAKPKAGGSFANIPGDILFPYAAMDADVTKRAYNGLRAEEDFTASVEFQRLADVYYPQFTQTLAEIEYEGAQIDPEVVAWLDRRYRRKMDVLGKRIQNFPVVREFVRDQRREAEESGDKAKMTRLSSFNPDSSKQLQKILFGYYGCTPLEMTDGGFSRLVHRFQTRQEEWRKRAAGTRGKKQDFSDIVREAIENEEWEHFSTKADVLQELKRRGNELCAPVLEFRGYSTLHGTFVKPLQTMLDDKQRIHGTYMAHGTVTARLASRDPNLQNIPNKGGGLIKRAYISRHGDQGVLLQLDYSQVELRIAACLFNEPEMIRAYREGIDLHYLTALHLSGKSAEAFSNLSKDAKKDWRTRSKRVNFGTLYGGGPAALVRTLQKDGVFVTDREARRLIDDYFRARPGLKRGIDALQRKVKKTGYVDAFTGHRRRVREVFSDDEALVARALRQVINFPVQCGAAQMTNMSLVLLHRALVSGGFQSRVVLTVHDSIVVDCHVDELFEVARLGKEIMETIDQRSEEVLPGLDWGWLQVPIVADIETGFTWGTMSEWSKCEVDGEARVIDPYDPDVDWLWSAMTLLDEQVAA